MRALFEDAALLFALIAATFNVFAAIGFGTGDYAVGMGMLTLGIIFLMVAWWLQRKRWKRWEDSRKPLVSELPERDLSPEEAGRIDGQRAASELVSNLAFQKWVAEREIRESLNTKVGRLFMSLTYDWRDRQWRVAVPKGEGDWNFKYFDDYEDAKTYYGAAKKALLEAIDSYARG